MATFRSLTRIYNAIELLLGASTPDVSPADRTRQYYDATGRRVYRSINGSPYWVEPITLGTLVASATVANTASETTIVGTVTGGKTLPAALLVAGKTVRVRAFGVLSSTGTPNLTVKVKFGSTVIATTGAVAQSGTPTDVGWELDCLITCRTTGASGTVFAQGVFRYGTVVMPLAATAAVTVDTTGAHIIDLTAQWGAMDPGNTITCTNGAIELLN